MNRRRSECRVACLPFDVYCRARPLGRFWTNNLSQEGLFLSTVSDQDLDGAILDLHFQVAGVEHCLRGIVADRIQGQGVWIQLAYWRKGSRAAHSAYLACWSAARPLVPYSLGSASCSSRHAVAPGGRTSGYQIR